MEEKERFINTIKDVNNDENIIPSWIFEENARLKREQEMEFAFEDGEEKGIESNQRRVIINMLEENVDYDFISKVTGKTIEEIREIEKTI